MRTVLILGALALATVACKSSSTSNGSPTIEAQPKEDAPTVLAFGIDGMRRINGAL